MEPLKLYEGEYRFAEIVWEHEPLPSKQLVALCAQRLGWKKSTTYTVLKRLCERGLMKNENTVVTALVKREAVQKYESEQLVERVFGGSLPQFITAFMGNKRITMEEAEDLKQLIDQYKEESQ